MGRVPVLGFDHDYTGGAGRASSQRRHLCRVRATRSAQCAGTPEQSSAQVCPATPHRRLDADLDDLELLVPDNLDTGKDGGEKYAHRDHARDQKDDVILTHSWDLHHVVQAEAEEEQEEESEGEAHEDRDYSEDR